MNLPDPLPALPPNSCARTVLFESANGNFFRIPGLIHTTDKTLLAFVQRRQTSVHDHGHASDILLRRSIDNGTTWEPPQTVASRPETDIHNGPVIQDPSSGRIIKFFRFWPVHDWKHLLFQTAAHEMEHLGYGDYIAISTDNGASWSDPAPHSLPFPPHAVSVGTGNGGHGAVLCDGSLAIAAGFRFSGCNPQIENAISLVLHSSDGGRTWRPAAQTDGLSSREFVFSPLPDGSIYCNFRNPAGGSRLVCLAPPDFARFGDIHPDPALPEPVCHAGLTFIPPRTTLPNGLLLFSCPNNRSPGGFRKETRNQLVVRASPNGGATWPYAILLWPGAAAYSDLAWSENNGILSIHVLYEEGDGNDSGESIHRRIVHQRFPLALLRPETAP